VDLDPADEVRLLGDQLRVLADNGLRWATGDAYDRHRYEEVRAVAARLFALADERTPLEIEREVFARFTHVAPIPVGDAAVIDDDGRILLIQRADDRCWAMPGGALELGETPAEGAVRETREEAGVDAEVVGLAGVWDSRRCGSRTALHLYQFVFLCLPVGTCEASTPHEVLDIGWFDEGSLPPLSPGHDVRVPEAFAFRRTGRSWFD
jgi:ADP-ribose pyrophosphatase YjhB (NUDIX family)